MPAARRDTAVSGRAFRADTPAAGTTVMDAFVWFERLVADATVLDLFIWNPIVRASSVS